jgi:hypothetical protein
MDVPTYSLAERDRRWALARNAAGIAEVLREHHLEHAAVGEDGPTELNPLTAQLLRA